MSCIAEGLACALQCFDDLKQQLRDSSGVVPLQRHLILVCNSLPFQLPVQETPSFLGAGLDQLIAGMHEVSERAGTERACGDVVGEVWEKGRGIGRQT